MMNNDWKCIRTGILQFLFGAALSAIAFALYIYSAKFPMETESLLEIAQELLLFLSSFLFALIASRSRASAGAFYLIAGFTSVCFIRELDASFDLIFHGAWKYVALLYLGFLFLIIRKAGFKTIVPGLARYCRSRSFMMMLPGIVIILAYSRLYGFKYLWKLYIAPPDIMGTVKMFSEESVELLGYGIIFCAALVALQEQLGRPRSGRRRRPYRGHRPARRFDGKRPEPESRRGS